MAGNIKAKIELLERQIQGDSDLQSCAALLTELKVRDERMLPSIALTTLPGLAPATHVTASAIPLTETIGRRDIALARDVYELATLLSVKQEDDVSFERHVAQVKTYYVDYAGVIPQSGRQNLILGLNLLRLMAQNRIAEFHTELELVPPSARGDKYINYPLRLENYLMEGSYSKIREEKIAAPDASFNLFVDMLMNTVREEIAACCERAYKSLGFESAQKMLSISSEEELMELCAQKGWNVEGGVISFADQEEVSPAIDQVRSEDFITRSLLYARELEQII
ncbi:Proteasome component [Gracilaria domingensis]|nr:Proteasome component [Gracilaria domingensis]